MIYLNSDRTDYITSENYRPTPWTTRADLDARYHAPTAQELYDFIDAQPTWDSVPAEAYEQLADLCGVEYDPKEDEGDTLMEKCEEALKKTK